MKTEQTIHMEMLMREKGERETQMREKSETEQDTQKVAEENGANW